MSAKRTKTATFAFDTENVVMLDGIVMNQKEMAEKLKDVPAKEMRKRVSCHVWAWQCYDEHNGFFMTENFEEFLKECCLRGYKFGWCYNASFDFAQIDYQILALGKDKWKPHEHKKVGYDRGQPWTFSCLQNDMGARYSYKLWVPYKAENRHTRTHALEIRDFMKFCAGGLEKVLEDLDVRDNEGKPLRKLKMDYQSVKIDNLTPEEVAYCEMDVKALYFAVKQFNETIEEISDGECHIFGDYTNLLTSGGLAKRMLLKSIYPNDEPRTRIKKYQKEHPLKANQDKYLREKHLYRGGITFLNPAYKGKLINKRMYRYDVNSEYPYAMSQIRSLVGNPIKMSLSKWLKMPKKDKEWLEAVYVIDRLEGAKIDGMLGIFYNPFSKKFEDYPSIKETFLIFERELMEYSNWYDLEYECSTVLAWPRGDKLYKPFVEHYYPLKSTAKNPTMKKVIKLILNSSYGKLSQRIEMNEGRYELNEETGTVHYVSTGTTIDESGRMSVVDGALVTSFARCYILSKIREICPVPERDFVYIDTDSIHSFTEYDNADKNALGGLKCEMITEKCKYLLPKTYVDIEETNGYNISVKKLEIHSKGVSISAIFNSLAKGGKTIDLRELDERMDYGQKFTCLQSMNVKGGKALVPVTKYLARKELAPEGWEKVVYSNMGGEHYGEI